LPPVWKLAPASFEQARARLRGLGLAFEDRPRQLFLARAPGVSVSLYANGTVVLGGSDGAAMRKVEAILEQLGGTRTAKSRPAPDPIEAAVGTRIGTDESGKGDYFGPLVVAGALVTPKTEPLLKALGVRDSKTISDERIATMAAEIREIAAPRSFEEILIGPSRYNQLFDSKQGISALLGWAHASAIERLLERSPTCKLAVADQFGDDRAIKKALMPKGRQIRLLQTPKAERDLAVAAASVLARDRFVRALAAMSEKWGFVFPKGSSHVSEAGVAFVRAFGEEAMPVVAKLHFATTAAIRRAAGQGPSAVVPR
jgi:ribonuclease HIII